MPGIGTIAAGVGALFLSLVKIKGPTAHMTQTDAIAAAHRLDTSIKAWYESLPPEGQAFVAAQALEWYNNALALWGSSWGGFLKQWQLQSEAQGTFTPSFNSTTPNAAEYVASCIFGPAYTIMLNADAATLSANWASATNNGTDSDFMYWFNRWFCTPVGAFMQQKFNEVVSFAAAASTPGVVAPDGSVQRNSSISEGAVDVVNPGTSGQGTGLVSGFGLSTPVVFALAATGVVVVGVIVYEARKKT